MTNHRFHRCPFDAGKATGPADDDGYWPCSCGAEHNTHVHPSAPAPREAQTSEVKTDVPWPPAHYTHMEGLAWRAGYRAALAAKGDV